MPVSWASLVFTKSSATFASERALSSAAASAFTALSSAFWPQANSAGVMASNPSAPRVFSVITPPRSLLLEPSHHGRSRGAHSASVTFGGRAHFRGHCASPPECLSSDIRYLFVVRSTERRGLARDALGPR